MRVRFPNPLNKESRVRTRVNYLTDLQSAAFDHSAISFFNGWLLGIEPKTVNSQSTILPLNYNHQAYPLSDLNRYHFKEWLLRPPCLPFHQVGITLRETWTPKALILSQIRLPFRHQGVQEYPLPDLNRQIKDFESFVSTIPLKGQANGEKGNWTLTF